MVLCYGALLAISLRLAWSDPMRLTFNSMLSHLFHWQFDVDPQIVGYEGYPYNGRVYAYWGIWPAFLRLPLWILRRMDVDITIWSCFAAVCLAAVAKVRAVLLVRRSAIHSTAATWAIGLMLGYILLGGSEVAYLRISIYQEVILWAYAFATFFVCFAIKGLVTRRFDEATLCAMALCAGLALLTRASTGVGVVVAMGLLLAVLALEPQADSGAATPTPLQRLKRVLTQRRILLPLAVLTMLVAMTGAVNYFRWGNPTTFVRYSEFCSSCSNDLRQVLLHSLYNFKRIPFGLIYYFFPVWVFHGSGGHLFMETTQTQALDCVELPPSSFFLTDLLPFSFIALSAAGLWRRRPAAGLSARRLLAIAIGLFLPCLLMLSLTWMDYRYRMEFYPEIDFLALLGLYWTVTDEKMLATFARYRKLVVATLVVSIASSFVAVSLYDLSNFGPSEDTLRQGVVQFYSQSVAQHFHKVWRPTRIQIK